jgi:hypothetical protein
MFAVTFYFTYFEKSCLIIREVYSRLLPGGVLTLEL